MKGKNVLLINHATMQDAVQTYLKRIAPKLGSKVIDVKQRQDSRAFAITLKGDTDVS